MNENTRDLYKSALKALGNAYAPYSKHPVGAALRADNGKIYAGCNVETAHYIVVHAEASAISAMISDGARMIKDVVVIGEGDTPCTPCGDCRQRIREFADEETKIYVYSRKAEQLKSYTIDVLLPDSFGPERLGQ